jgi:hypothetical protein
LITAPLLEQALQPGMLEATTRSPVFELATKIDDHLFALQAVRGAELAVFGLKAFGLTLTYPSSTLPASPSRPPLSPPLPRIGTTRHWYPLSTQDSGNQPRAHCRNVTGSRGPQTCKLSGPASDLLIGVVSSTKSPSTSTVY